MIMQYHLQRENTNFYFLHIPDRNYNCWLGL